MPAYLFEFIKWKLAQIMINNQIIIISEYKKKTLIHSEWVDLFGNRPCIRALDIKRGIYV